MKFLDLCSGIGGFHLGLNKLECIMACDIDKSCQEVYQNNFNNKICNDIFDLSKENLPDYDILCAGFPCQPFSIAGLKKGLEDKRTKVYSKIINIINDTHPKIIILENVKNLINFQKGLMLNKILEDIQELNYNITYALLNTNNFGLPQNRERIFLIAVSKKFYSKSFDFSKLLSIDIKKNLKDIIDPNEKNYLSKDRYIILDKKLHKKQKSGLIFCGYIKGNLRQNGVLPHTQHLSRVHKQPNRIYHIDGVNPTLSTSETSGRYFIYDKIGVRKLTVEECYAIMGFPKEYNIYPKKNKAYAHIGNAVSPLIIKMIYEELVNQGFI